MRRYGWMAVRRMQGGGRSCWLTLVAFGSRGGRGLAVDFLVVDIGDKKMPAVLAKNMEGALWERQSLISEQRAMRYISCGWWNSLVMAAAGDMQAATVATSKSDGSFQPPYLHLDPEPNHLPLDLISISISRLHSLPLASSMQVALTAGTGICLLSVARCHPVIRVHLYPYSRTESLSVPLVSHGPTGFMVPTIQQAIVHTTAPVCHLTRGEALALPFRLQVRHTIATRSALSRQ